MAGTTDSRFPNGRSAQRFTGDVYRTDTTSKDLFVLPPNSVIISVAVIGVAASDASSTATISCGFKGNLGNEFFSAYDVKTAATGLGLSFPNAKAGATNSNGISYGSNAITVTGKYAETGSASSTGGPWTIVFDVLTV